MAFESSTLSIEVTSNPNVVRIESAPSGTDYQFYSLKDDIRLQSGVGGGRAFVALVGGVDSEVLANSGGAITPSHPLRSIKMLHEGINTKLQVSLCLTLAETDFPTTVYAQLYSASNFNSTQLQPVPNTLIDMGTIPTGAPVGTIVSAGLDNLSISVAPGTQLFLGFYCTTTAAVTSGVVGYFSGIMRVEG